MRRLTRLLCLGVLTMGASSVAFGKCTAYAWDIKLGQARGAANLECAAQAEKAGKLSDAMGFYWGVYSDDCSGEKACSAPDAQQREQARQAIMRVGRTLGAQAEKSNRLDGSYVFILEGDDYWVVKADAGAIGLYEDSFNYAETDRIVLNLIKSSPANLDIFSRAVAHFGERERLREPAGYRYNPAHLVELQKTAAANVEQALVREEEEFKKRASLTDISDAFHFSRSLSELKLAMRWHEPMRLNNEKIYLRGKQRGDNLMKGSPAPWLIRHALEYYKLAGDQGWIKQAKDVANKLGDDAAKNGEIEQAREYFRIAGNDPRARELGDLMAKRNKALKEKREKETHKDKQQQEQFKNEQNKLEKELGL